MNSIHSACDRLLSHVNSYFNMWKKIMSHVKWAFSQVIDFVFYIFLKMSAYEIYIITCELYMFIWMLNFFPTGKETWSMKSHENWLPHENSIFSCATGDSHNNIMCFVS